MHSGRNSFTYKRHYEPLIWTYVFCKCIVLYIVEQNPSLTRQHSSKLFEHNYCVLILKVLTDKRSKFNNKTCFTYKSKTEKTACMI